MQPKFRKNKVLYIRADEEFLENVKRNADKYGISISSYVRTVTEFAMNSDLMDILKKRKEIEPINITVLKRL